jgi:hypothetical protein
MTREQGTGNREQGTGNREQGTGNREEVLGNFSLLMLVFFRSPTYQIDKYRLYLGDAPCQYVTCVDSTRNCPEDKIKCLNN